MGVENETDLARFDLIKVCPIPAYVYLGIEKPTYTTNSNLNGLHRPLTRHNAWCRSHLGLDSASPCILLVSARPSHRL
jgi:hypothetical protein